MVYVRTRTSRNGARLRRTRTASAAKVSRRRQRTRADLEGENRSWHLRSVSLRPMPGVVLQVGPRHVLGKLANVKCHMGRVTTLHNSMPTPSCSFP